MAGYLCISWIVFCGFNQIINFGMRVIEVFLECCAHLWCALTILTLMRSSLEETLKCLLCSFISDIRPAQQHQQMTDELVQNLRHMRLCNSSSLNILSPKPSVTISQSPLSSLVFSNSIPRTNSTSTVRYQQIFLTDLLTNGLIRYYPLHNLRRQCLDVLTLV